jgi:hypothetical protein
MGSSARAGTRPAGSIRSLNLRLARRAYSGPEGAVDLIPGPGLICVAAISATGERVSGVLSTGWISSTTGVFGFTRGGQGPEGREGNGTQLDRP